MSILNGLSNFEKQKSLIFLSPILRSLKFQNIEEFEDYINLLKNENVEFKEFRNNYGNTLESLLKFLLTLDKEYQECLKIADSEDDIDTQSAFLDCTDSYDNVIDDIIKMLFVTINELPYTPHNPEVLNILKDFIEKNENQ